jgi:tetratricopeptide (TPR) repeat protein
VEPSTQSSQTTDPAHTGHPLKQFLQSCGFNISNFPILRFIIEVSDRSLRTHRICIPIRFIENQKNIFETYFRIARVQEIPIIGSSRHRKFLEIEWLIDPEAYTDNELHSAVSFLASELSCPSCRANFAPKPIFIDDVTAKISCPQCLQDWNLQAKRSSAEHLPTLLLDMFRKEPDKTRELLARWTEQPVEASDSFYYSIFPYHFEQLEQSPSLELILNELPVYSALSNGPSGNFEILIRGFINHLSRAGLIEKRLPSALEKTDIQIKNIADADSSQNAQVIPFAKAPLELSSNLLYDAIAKKKIESFAWNPDQFTDSKKAPPTQSTFKRGISIAVAATLFLSIGLSAYLYQGQTSHPIAEVPLKIEIAELPSDSLVQDSEQRVEQKSEAPRKIEKLPEQQESLRPVTVPKVPDPKSASKNVVQELRKTIREEHAASPAKNKKTTLDAAYRQGMMHLKLQQGREAAEDFENILKIDPANTSSYRGLGLAYYFDQKYDLSVKAFEKYLELAKNGDDRESIEKMLKILRERATTAAANP